MLGALQHPICRAARTLGLLALLTPLTASAQEACDFVAPGNDLVVRQPPFAYVTNPNFLCEGNVRMQGDSAVLNADQGMFLMLGSVRYSDGVRELTSAEARYFIDAARLQARGDVRVTNNDDGSVVENGDLVYLRQTDFREIEEMTVTTGDDGIRPRATVYPKRPEPEPVDSLEASTPPDEPIDGAPPDGPDADTVAPAVPDADTSAADTVDVPEPAGIDRPDEPGGEPPEDAELQEYVVVADSLFFRGDSYFTASGTVEITRDSLFAFADSTEYSPEVGELLLAGSARVEAAPYELVGRTVTLTSAADGSDEILARRDAVLTGQDLRVTAPRIIVRLVDGEVERMVAVPLPELPDSALAASPDEEPQTDTRTAGAGRARRLTADAPGDSVPADTVSLEARRPYAISEEIELTGDSLDLAAPGGVLQRIFAAGTARSVSSGRADLNVDALPELATQDWIDADTIEVLLVPSSPASASDAAPDDAYEVERIIARVGARSLYRLVPSDSTAVVGVDPPAVSYMVANQITIFMVDGVADRVESEGQVSGWHLEPLSRPAEEPSEEEAGDSTSASPDGQEPPDAAPEPTTLGDGGDAGPPGV